MEKQPLSQRLYIYGALLMLIAFVIVFSGARSILVSNDEDTGTLLLLILLGLILFAAGFYFAFYFPVLAFDSDFLYITKNKTTKQVPLSKVYKIKATMIKLGFTYLWKIGYTDEDGNNKAVRFLPKYFSESFVRFTASVKNHNTNVSVKNWSWSFDFDQ